MMVVVMMVMMGMMGVMVMMGMVWMKVLLHNVPPPSPPCQRDLKLKLPISFRLQHTIMIHDVEVHEYGDDDHDMK